MKKTLYICYCLLLVACGSTKSANMKQPSLADLQAIQTFHQAIRYKITGQYDKAILTFDSCLKMNPSNDAAAFGLSQSYLLSNNPSKAVEYTQLASKLDPSNIWYTQELAYMYYNIGKFEQAEPCFAKMIKAQPANIDWLFGYADVLKRLKKEPEAISTLNKMEEQLGVLPDLSLQKYELYMAMKQEDKALQEIHKARKDYPDELALIGTLIDYYFSKNEVPKAQEMLIELVKNDPQNARANLALGDLYYRQFNKTEAYKYFKASFQGAGVDIDTKMSLLMDLIRKQVVVDKEVLELADLLVQSNPNDAKPYTVKADILLQNGDKINALNAYREALKYDDTKFPIWNQVLILDYELLQFDDLYKDARACAALYPTIANVQLLYTIACVQLKRYQEAIDAANSGKELVVNDVVMESEFYAQKGDALFALQKIEEAKKEYEKALSVNPNAALIKNNYAMRLALANTDLSLALKTINEVIEKNGNQAPFLDTKGFVLFQLGKYKEALAEFAKADALIPENKSFVEHLGDAFSKLGETEKALELWKKAQSLGSKNKSLSKKIQTKNYVAPEY